MKLALIVSTALSLFFSSALFSEPQNIALLQQEIVQYHDSGAYEKEIKTTLQQAQQYIDSQVQLNNQRKVKQKLAIVLDIDETSLSNYDNIIQGHFQSSREEIHRSILLANAKPIQPMLALYNDALAHEVSIFFVTGRRLSELKATQLNLTRAGYRDWSGLFLRSETDNAPSVVSFKAHTRDIITKRGYTIIASIGDQNSDIEGGFAQKGFKLPNPFYFLP